MKRPPPPARPVTEVAGGHAGLVIRGAVRGGVIGQNGGVGLHRTAGRAEPAGIRNGGLAFGAIWHAGQSNRDFRRRSR